MARVKRGMVSRRRHNKLFELTKGYQGHRSKLVRQAKEAILHAGQHAFAGRRQRRRDIRRLWITKLGIATQQEGLSYSRFIALLKSKNILLNRKMLAEIVVNDYETFKKITAEVR